MRIGKMLMVELWKEKMMVRMMTVVAVKCRYVLVPV